MDAPRIARALVAGGFAACVNVLDGARSTYRWRGKVEEAREALLLVKTTRARLRACLARLVEVHPYEVPEALVLTPGQGLAAYVEWVVKTTGPRPP
jgi:periplasmic divalent cation tolerance protein